jgi:hypothetical protein
MEAQRMQRGRRYRQLGAVALAAVVVACAVVAFPSHAVAFNMTPGAYSGTVTASGGQSPGHWSLTVSDSGAVSGTFQAFIPFHFAQDGCNITVPISVHGTISGHTDTTGDAVVAVAERGSSGGSEHCHFAGTTTSPGATITVPIPAEGGTRAARGSFPLLEMEQGTTYPLPSLGLVFTMTSWPRASSTCLKNDLKASFACIFDALTQKVWNGVPFEVSAGTSLKTAGRHVIDLIAGTVLISTRRGRDAKLHIVTQTVVVAVRGTQFEVQDAGGATTVHVFKGLVEITGLKHKRRHVLLHAEHMAVVSAAGHLSGPTKFSPSSVPHWWSSAG